MQLKIVVLMELEVSFICLTQSCFFDTRMVTISSPSSHSIGDVAMQDIGFSLLNFKDKNHELPDFSSDNP